MIKGKIVLVPFPFDDLSATKVRPALCLTNATGRFRHIIVAFITSQMPGDVCESDLMIETNHPDFVLTGLRVNSVIRLHRLTTFPSQLFQRELGRLSENLLKEVAFRLTRLFELEEPKKA